MPNCEPPACEAGNHGAALGRRTSAPSSSARAAASSKPAAASSGVLEAADAVALADRLQTEIDAGHAARYGQLRASELEALPQVPCALCEGAGRRTPPPENGRGRCSDGHQMQWLR